MQRGTVEKMRQQWISLLAVLVLAVTAVAPSLRAADAPAADPKPEDYVQLVDVRVNKLQKSLDDFKAFLEHGVPMAAQIVMGEAYTAVVHTSNLNGLDGNRAAHTIAYVPKMAFTMTPEDLANKKIEPVLVEFIPVKDAKVYLDKLGEEVDEITKDGDYQKFTDKKTQRDVFFKVVGNYALFSNAKAGVDLGAAQAAALVAADEKSTDTASLTLEIRPQDVLNKAGLTKPEDRKKALAALEAAAVETLNQAGPMTGAASMANGKDLRKALQFGMDLGDRCESCQLRATFSAESASIGVRVKALDGSDISKALAGAKKIDTAHIHVPASVSPMLVLSGAPTPGLRELCIDLIKKANEEDAKALAPVLESLKAFDGQQFNIVLGMQGPMGFGAAGEATGADGTDAAALVDSSLKLTKTMMEKKQGNGKEMGQMDIGAFKDGADGWKQRDVTIMAANGQTQFVTYLVKGAKAVWGMSITAENALADAKEMAEAKSEWKPSPEFAAYLKKSNDDRGGMMLMCIDPRPAAGALAAMGMDPATVTAIQKLVEKTNPPVIQAFVNGNTVDMELRLEAEAVKQYTAAVMQVMMQMGGGGRGPGGPGGDVPPPPTDF